MQSAARDVRNGDVEIVGQSRLQSTIEPDRWISALEPLPQLISQCPESNLTILQILQ
jgi:hypothetical protein